MSKTIFGLFTGTRLRLATLMAATLIGLFTAAMPSPASAENHTFNAPQQGGKRLDWCYNWSQGCGAQAATAWCQAQGYSGGAIGFSQAPNIGAAQPTRLIGTGAICDQGFCSGFAQITCTRPNVAQTFANPMEGSNRLDWCFNWAQGCGAQAATAWCQARGFAGGAIGFTQAANIGLSHPTRLIGTGAVCDQGFCSGFASITCSH